jgi:hypothetical protein
MQQRNNAFDKQLKSVCWLRNRTTQEKYSKAVQHSIIATAQMTPWTALSW